MVTKIADDGESLHQRRQSASQYQPDEMIPTESKNKVRSNRIPFRLAIAKDKMKYISGHPVGAAISLLVIGLMALNLNQGPMLKDFVAVDKNHHNSNTNIRSLEISNAASCRKTPYVGMQDAAFSMPLTPPWYDEEQPSHIILCNELMKRNDYVANQQDQEEGGGLRSKPFSKFIVHESPELCADWSKPHSALMQLISSSIIAFVGERFGLEYKHHCHDNLNAEYRRNLNFDVTTVQEIFAELRMPIDQRLLKLGEVVYNLCSNCVEEYKFNKESNGETEATHHCLAFPDHGAVKLGMVNKQVTGADGMPEIIQQEELVDSQGNIFHTALESVLPLVRDRLWHVARDWHSESKIPRGDPKTGVVIFIDAGTSMPLPLNLYLQSIPQYATHIDIISGPNCANGNLAISMSHLQPIKCLKHGSELRDYLRNHFSDLGVEVTFTLLSSTAASYTRMIQTNTLICPPESFSCLLPALAKQGSKNTVIFESPESSTYTWFNYLGKSVKNIEVIRLTHGQMSIDQEEQFIDAKYAGFSTDQVVGPKPPGLFRPYPSKTMTKKSSTSSSTTLGHTSDMNMNPNVYSEEENVNTATSYNPMSNKVTNNGSDNDNDFDTHYSTETNVVNNDNDNDFDTHYSAEANVGDGDENSSEGYSLIEEGTVNTDGYELLDLPEEEGEYELLDSEEESVSGGGSPTNIQSLGETDFTVGHQALSQSTMGDNHSENNAHLFDNSQGEAADHALDADTKTKTNSEEEVDVDYSILF